MDTLKLSQVSARGFGGTIGAKNVTMKVTFGCPFTKQAAKVLDLEWLYNQNGEGGLRGFKDHKAAIEFPEADVTFAKTKDERISPLVLRCPVGGIEVVREDKVSTLKFHVTVPLTTIEMTAYLQEQLREPCFQVVIKGTQKEFDFAPKRRGRPKKEKDKPQ